ncbi:MAG TPA: hypothetical protein PKD52_05695 [Clostridiales bacterium]|nr:hypothetical protein [Clostridiales bacterium]
MAVLLVLAAMVFSGCGGPSTETIPGADQRVVTAYEDAVAHYQKHTDLADFWGISAAYAVFGDEIQDGSYTFDLSAENSEQQGAVVLGLIMMGENPYDYQGEDLVSDLAAAEVSGGFAIPVFYFLALQAAGAPMSAETEAAYVDYCCKQLETVSMGPDIGGWAAVALERYMAEPAYRERIAAAIDGYISVISEDLASGTMGSTGISAGCVVTGLTALTDAGLSGYDVTKDEPWLGEDPLAMMYDNLMNGEENVSSYYNSQYYLEFVDLYQVLYKSEDMAWIRCGVNGEKLRDLMTAGEALAAENPADKTLAVALKAAKQLTDEELSASVPSWGRVYYDLYDAVKQYK